MSIALTTEHRLESASGGAEPVRTALIEIVIPVYNERELPGSAWNDLRGLLRVAKAKARGTAAIAGLPRRPEPRAAHPDAELAAHRSARLTWQAISFAVVGLLSTLATAALYAIGREWWSPLEANLVAFTVTTALNVEANRRFTFARTGRGVLLVHAQAALIFLGYYALTSLALLALSALVPTPSRALEVAVLLAASVFGTVGRFLLLRGWVFATRPHRTSDWHREDAR